VGGVFGVAVLATIFSGAGGYGSPQQFIAGLVPALWVGAAVLGAGGLLALALPFTTGEQSAEPSTVTAPAHGGRPDPRPGVAATEAA
jgi:hypothetical protein